MNSAPGESHVFCQILPKVILEARKRHDARSRRPEPPYRSSYAVAPCPVVEGNGTNPVLLPRCVLSYCRCHQILWRASNTNFAHFGRNLFERFNRLDKNNVGMPSCSSVISGRKICLLEALQRSQVNRRPQRSGHIYISAIA